LISDLRELRSARELLAELTLREVRARYRGTFLGQAWSLVNPLAAMAIYTAVFAVLLRVRVPRGDPSGIDLFALWLLCGLLPWTFFNNCVTGGMSALVSQSNLIKKVFFPREVLVVSNSLSWLVTLGFELCVLTIALAVAGSPAVLLWVVAAVPVVLLLLVFGTGIGLLLSVLNVYFRDTAQLVGIGMQMWFYATPVVYPISLVPERFRSLYGLNPMERFTSCFRRLLYDGRPPRWQDLLAAAVASTVSLVVGYAVFQRFERRLAEEL
jgi:ABC-type polysaccharide/polyol phosphate export permease